MDQKLSEIVVLRPTAVFIAFLNSQLSDDNLPDLKSLQVDNTAYSIAKQNTDEGTLDEIENHFSTMFRHEICRWLGKDARNEIEKNFLDFLCCFKLELHSHVILMEPSLQEGRQLLQIKPKAQLFSWLKSMVEGQEELVAIMDKVSLSNLVENSTVMVKNFNNLSEIKPFIQQYYRPIFTTAMSRISNKPELWPEINSFRAFSQYFSIEVHTQLIHMRH